MARLLVIGFALSLAGCSGDTKSAPTNAPATAPAPTAKPGPGGKVHPPME